MDRRAQVVYGATSPTVDFYPTEGVASAAATVTVFAAGTGNDDTAETTGGTVAIDSLSLTLSAASGYSETNRHRLNLAPTGVVVGERYWLANAEGQHEVVTVTATGADYADVEYPLAYDYTTTSTLKGYRHTLTLGATWCGDETNINDDDEPWRVRWVYTVGGVTHRHWTYFDLLRFEQEDDVTDDDLADIWSDLPYTVDAGTRARALREARTRFETDVRARRYDPATLGPDELRATAIRACAMVVLAEQGKGPVGLDPEASIRRMTANYLRALDSTLPEMERLDARGEGGDLVVPIPLGFIS